MGRRGVGAVPLENDETCRSAELDEPLDQVADEDLAGHRKLLANEVPCTLDSPEADLGGVRRSVGLVGRPGANDMDQVQRASTAHRLGRAEADACVETVRGHRHHDRHQRVGR